LIKLFYNRKSKTCLFGRQVRDRKSIRVRDYFTLYSFILAFSEPCLKWKYFLWVFTHKKIAMKSPPRQLAGNAHQKGKQAQNILLTKE